MCVLSDVTISESIKKGLLVVEPFVRDHLQPSSIDLQLNPQVRIFKILHQAFIDVHDNQIKEVTELLTVDQVEGLIIDPGDFLLGSTVEYFEVPDTLVARIEGRSSLGRIGIIIHSTAGYVDPGFKGNITLEITNIGNIPVKIYPFMRIAQISFAQLSTPAARPYGTKGLSSKYQNQSGPVASKIYLDD